MRTRAFTSATSVLTITLLFAALLPASAAATVTEVGLISKTEPETVPSCTAGPVGSLGKQLEAEKKKAEEAEHKKAAESEAKKREAEKKKREAERKKHGRSKHGRSKHGKKRRSKRTKTVRKARRAHGARRTVLARYGARRTVLARHGARRTVL
ncbi:MAG: hypothetical protein ACYCYN_12890, partial [Solirubrobacteraceae bacterium]